MKSQQKPQHRLEPRAAPYRGVYFIQCEGFIKVGMAKDYERRLEALQAANPLPLRMVAVLEGERFYPPYVEADIHRKLRAHCVSGEWFRMTMDEIVEALPDYRAHIKAVTHPPRPQRPSRRYGPQPRTYGHGVVMTGNDATAHAADVEHRRLASDARAKAVYRKDIDAFFERMVSGIKKQNHA